MNVSAIILATPATVTGLVAARLWLKASRVEIPHPWKGITLANGTPADTLYVEGEHWVPQLGEAFSEAGRLNAKAAKWTAISVFAGLLVQLF